MGFLRPSDALVRTIHSSRMLHPGGSVGPGSYQRRIKNIIQSGRLIERITKEVPQVMVGNCKLTDHCAPVGKPELVGKIAPDGNPYISCTPEERISRLKSAYECAKRSLRKGAVAITPTPRRPIARRTREDLLRELGL